MLKLHLDILLEAFVGTFVLESQHLLISTSQLRLQIVIRLYCTPSRALRLLPEFLRHLALSDVSLFGNLRWLHSLAMLFLRLPGYLGGSSQVNSTLRTVCLVLPAVGALSDRLPRTGSATQLVQLSSLCILPPVHVKHAAAAGRQPRPGPAFAAQPGAAVQTCGGVGGGFGRGFAAIGSPDASASEIFDRRGGTGVA